MKQAFSIFFAIYFLIGGFLPKMDFSQLIYLGEALDHFKCHQSEDTHAGEFYGLVDFVLAHFIFPDHHQHQDDDPHEDLPLQQFNHGLQFLAADILSTPKIYDLRHHQDGGIAFIQKIYGCDYYSRVEHPPSTLL